MSEEQSRLKFDGVQLVAGALTAVTSAVLLSTFGVAGTLIGVAVGSVIGTVGNAVYSHYLALSSRRVAAAKVLAEARGRNGHGTAHGVKEQLAREELAAADVDPVRARKGGVSWREAVRGLPWRRILPVAVVVGVIALAAIVVFELAAGRAISTFTGGTDEPRRTSIPGVQRDRAPDRDPDRDRQQQEPTPQPEESDAPAPDVTPTPTPPTEPTTEPTPTPTTEPEATEDPAPLEEPDVPEPSPEPSSTP